MNIYTKILLTTLPLVVFFLFATVGTTYHFSKNALVDLGETWLDTRLYEAMEIVRTQNNMLHEYGLEKIAASIAKAKLDAAAQSAVIGVGEQGYIFAVDINGIIIFHPSRDMIGINVYSEKWFNDMNSGEERLMLNMKGKPSLARFEYFKEWEWFILAADPMEEVYGATNRMRPWLYLLVIVASLVISLALMFLTRRLTRPLAQLVQGAEKIGKGELKVRIPILTNDEFSYLAREFNHMASRLQETLTALQYSEEYFRALIENANDLIWVLDTHGNFIYASPSTRRLLGYSPKELLGTNAFDLLHPEDKKALVQRFDLRTQSLAKAQLFEHRSRHKKGYLCTIESISRNLLKHPAINGMVINSRDISERKIAENALKQSHQKLETRVKERTTELLILNKTLNKEIQIRKEKEIELKKANQAKGEFLANVSHEIKTPLNSVIGFSELLSKMTMEKQQVSYLKAITTAGETLLALINDILDLSKIEAGKLTIHKVPVSLEVLFDETHRMFNARLKEKSLEFISEIDRKVPGFLFLDDMRFRQILTNLIDNAVKFTSKGVIRLIAKAQKPRGHAEGFIDLFIQVEDTGIGIPKDKTDIIFESFQQASAGTSRKFGGTGLGLSICKRLINLMGGSIFVTSAVEKGTRFEIYLPDIEISTKKTNEKKTNKKIKSAMDKTRFSEKKIHVPDDHEPIQQLLEKIMEKNNLDPEFKAGVMDIIMPLLPELQEGMKINDIQKLATIIMEMGSKFQILEFESFGRELFHYTESFDVENISLSLKKLSTSLERLV
jgi:PAS domain S-box-containing protein